MQSVLGWHSPPYRSWYISSVHLQAARRVKHQAGHKPQDISYSRTDSRWNAPLWSITLSSRSTLIDGLDMTDSTTHQTTACDLVSNVYSYEYGCRMALHYTRHCFLPAVHDPYDI